MDPKIEEPTKPLTEQEIIEKMIADGRAEWVNHYHCPKVPKIRKYIKKLQAGATPEELGLDPKVLSQIKVKRVLVTRRVSQQ